MRYRQKCMREKGDLMVCLLRMKKTLRSLRPVNKKIMLVWRRGGEGFAA